MNGVRKPPKVRKQIYIEAGQERLLNRLCRETGASEGEIVRKALDQHARELRPLRHGLGAWEEERAFILQRIAQGPKSGHRTWRREDLHER